ncbi:MAG: hypothetical protein AAGK02_04630 [Pseudomonadota bacterium]
MTDKMIDSEKLAALRNEMQSAEQRMNSASQAAQDASQHYSTARARFFEYAEYGAAGRPRPNNREFVPLTPGTPLGVAVNNSLSTGSEDEQGQTAE